MSFSLISLVFEIYLSSAECILHNVFVIIKFRRADFPSSPTSCKGDSCCVVSCRPGSSPICGSTGSNCHSLYVVTKEYPLFERQYIKSKLKKRLIYHRHGHAEKWLNLLPGGEEGSINILYCLVCQIFLTAYESINKPTFCFTFFVVCLFEFMLHIALEWFVSNKFSHNVPEIVFSSGSNNDNCSLSTYLYMK